LLAIALFGWLTFEARLSESPDGIPILPVDCLFLLKRDFSACGQAQPEAGASTLAAQDDNSGFLLPG